VPERVRYLLTDIGSTTTKVLALEEGPDGVSVAGRAAHPTTVEAPYEDASIGFEAAVRELGLDALLQKESPRAGLMFTSSAAGGLKIVVVGLLQSITAESARKASMGAGGIILDVVSVDDGRASPQRADALRALRPDLILVAGGFRGYRGRQIIEICEVLAMGALPEEKLPLIYAGAGEVAGVIKDVLSPYYDVHVVPNLRPAADEENFAPTTAAIQELFMNHVMSRAPGYDRVQRLAHRGIIPTPLAAGRMVTLLEAAERCPVLAVDIGGATTDVFSCAGGVMYRTVSASLGMSYSLGNTLVEAGGENFRGWMALKPDEKTIRNAVYNKVVNPTRLPVNELQRQIDSAGAIEALRLALAQHIELTRTLPPVVEGGLGPLASREDLAARMAKRRARLNMLDVGLIVGSGGCLAHAPSPREAARILVESLVPQGVTRLVLDTLPALSHFGNLSREDPELGLDLCRRHLDHLVTVISPVGKGRPGVPAIEWAVISDAGGRLPSKGHALCGDALWLDLRPGESAEMNLKPDPGLDLGEGPGRPVKTRVEGGLAGLLVDCRRSLLGRDGALPPLPADRPR